MIRAYESFYLANKACPSPLGGSIHSFISQFKSKLELLVQPSLVFDEPATLALF
jgi:hypothetical protein